MGALAVILTAQTSGASSAGAEGSGVADVGAAILEPERSMRPTPLRQPTSVNHEAARISIPKLGLTARVGRNLDSGPIWWPVTGRPGGGDTVAIAGHRTTHTHPFLDLDRLASGDVIDVRWQGNAYRYVVSGRRIVSSKNLHIADARGYEVLLLTACTPKGSARQRIVIYARPADPDLRQAS